MTGTVDETRPALMAIADEMDDMCSHLPVAVIKDEKLVKRV